MWKATAGLKIEDVAPVNNQDDDWETDPDFVNDVSEQEQRWGSKTVAGSGRTAGAIDMDKLRHETERADQDKKKKEMDELNPGYGYGGKFGVQTDRVDKSAAGWDHIEKVEKHASQKDYSTGFGGKFGLQTDRVDKSAAGWDHVEKVEKHASQKDYATGFGGKFGLQTDRVDKSAVGWDHVEKVEKHESQKDYSKGFGGKFGIQEDRKDKSAVGWDHKETVEKHESQLDHKVGFGGKFGVQKDRMDKSAAGYDSGDKQTVGTSYTKVKPNIEGAKPSNLRAKFENLAKMSEEESRKRSEEQKRLREEKDKRDREEAAKHTIVENTPRPAAEEARTPPAKGSRSVITTGRQGSIGNAISAFNQLQSPTTTDPPPVRKEPIVIPKENHVPVVKTEPNNVVAQPIVATTTNLTDFETVTKTVTEEVPEVKAVVEEGKVDTVAAVVAPVLKETIVPPVLKETVAQAPPPDIIPAIEIQTVATPPEIESPNEQPTIVHAPEVINNEPLYQNQDEIAQQNHHQQQPQQQQQAEVQSQYVEEHNANNIALNNTEFSTEEAIYANSENLADYLEDTGLRAIALYDYQAADDDEISFDPDDIVSHIEMIDEGWWRGLCKNRYGLFPANYVQLINLEAA